MTQTSTRRPTAQDAAHVVRRGLGGEAATVERFTTGHCHYVYDVTTTDGRRVAARLAFDETEPLLAGGVYWHARLRDVGVPVPRLLAADLTPPDGFPYMLLERLPGADLGDVYATLTPDQRRAIAERVVALQRAVSGLPRATGYGFAVSYADPQLRPGWADVVLDDVERSRQRIAASGVVPLSQVDRVRERALASGAYLRAVEPIPFLDDTTTKNVLVHEGTLSGVVDTDFVCFGDPLYPLALTTLALRVHQLDSDYADYWRGLLALSAERERALRLYITVFCLGFISEVGQRFNRDAPASVDTAYLRRLEALLEELLAAGD